MSVARLATRRMGTSRCAPIAAAFLAASACTSPAFAQNLVDPGDAVITRFSGTVAGPGGNLIVDTNGPAAIGLNLANPGAPAAGRDATASFPEKFRVTAADVGQVFGVAIRAGDPAIIYFSATSAFGLHLAGNGSGWMPGQWGAGGGPGTIYRLSTAPNSRPEIFAAVTLDGRRNTGAALGAIAYDRWNNQLFVSDLETGMIHRLNADTGQELGRYDHGVEARPKFTDLARMATGARPAVAFDPASKAKVDNCPDGDFEATPTCWNIADYRRRVFALGVYQDEAIGETRLYYSVWSSQAFGNPAWGTDPADQLNSVWSVALDSNGGIDTSDARLEFDVPGFFANEADYARAGGSNPVSDIAFSAIGDMVIAERGGIRNLGLDQAAPLAWPHESRVLKFRRDENRVWQPLGRYDVGFSDRRDLGQPFIRANAAGGAALGFGYGPDGRIDLGRPDAFVWMTGDGLCAADGPCIGADGTASDNGPLNGAQGQASDLTAEVGPDAAFKPYPTPGPATPPTGPDKSYMVDAVGSTDADPALADARAAWVGNIEIVPPGPAPAPPAGGEIDLAVTKVLPDYCIAGASCTAQITVTNVGASFWTGPIFLTDIATPAGATFIAASPPWSCAPIGATVGCYLPHVSLAPGEARVMVLDLAMPLSFTGGTLENCAAVTWPLATPNNSASVVRAVQAALTVLGYNPGPIDGSFGAMTAAAIGQLQADLGVPQTQAIDAALLSILFARDAGRPGDSNPSNDRGCDTTTLIPPPPPPVGVHLPLGSFGGHGFPASIHAPIGSGPGHAFPASVHLPIGSVPGHAFPWSIHLPIGSAPAHVFPASVHLPIGSGGGHAFPASIHLPLGSAPAHVFPWSIHLPIGSVPAHVFPWSIHLPVGSGGGHAFPASIHLPIGSGGGHAFPASIHLPIGSGGGHAFPASIHLPIGSGGGHAFPASIHLPIGSAPAHIFPDSIHLPIGSGGGHAFPASIHLPVGSAPAHLPLGSIHLPIGSAGGGPHLPVVSAGPIHLPVGSGGVHIPVVSGGAPPHLPIASAGPAIHLPVGSAIGPHVPVGSAGGIHLPVGSGAGAAPDTADEPTHLPVGSQPVHRPRGSAPQHLPIGSEPDDTPVHRPRGSEPQIHLPLGSEPQVHMPRGSEPQLHLPLGSEQEIEPETPIHRPRGSKGQVHLPLGSDQVFEPETPIHRPRGSLQVDPGLDVHNPVLSKRPIIINPDIFQPQPDPIR